MSNRRGLLHVAGALTVLGLLTACAASAAEDGTSPSASSAPALTSEPTHRVPLTGSDLVAIVDLDWVLSEATIDGEAMVLPESPLTAGFAETANGMQVLGNACNGFGGIVNGWPDSIAITDMVSTLMLCADEDLNAADSWFPAAVQRVTGVSRDGDQLIMWGDGFELIFDPAA